MTDLARVLIADDHAMFREGLSLILRGTHPDLSIAEAANFDQARRYLRADDTYDLLILDLLMPDMGWNEGLRTLTGVCDGNSTPVVIISARDTPEFIDECLRAGARAFIPKSMSGDDLVAALKVVLEGQTYVPAYYQAPARNAAATPQRRRKRSEDSAPYLTPRQRDVLRLLGSGRSNQEIADTLGLSIGTVKVHVSRILKFLGVRSRTAAALTAAELDLRE